MTGLTQSVGGGAVRRFVSEVSGWLQENVFGSVYKALALLALAFIAAAVFRAQLDSSPAMAAVVGGLWLLAAAMVVVSAARRRFDPLSLWLKDRLYNSVFSALVTLILVLGLSGVASAALQWAVLNANFSADAAVAAASEHTGATWGIVFANFKLFMVGQFDNNQLWRVWASIGVVAVLAAISFPVYGPWSVPLKPFRRFVTWAWLLSPLALWILLRGLSRAGPFPIIETRTWGGLLLTLAISVFAIVVSFPFGVMLALGRRSQFQGIPAWLTYGAVGAASAWGFVTYTLPNLALSRTLLEYVLILWPLWLLIAGAGFQRFFKGNVVAAFCTVYIESVRGVPLITVLFMANIMFPLFLPSGLIIENAFRAMWGFMFFSAAYLAENVRGGLQSIPRGQYEAAEALGLNTFQQLRYVILPQALRVVIPPIVGQFISLFKDTSLVAIVGLLDLLNIANATVAQPDWLGLRREVYVFITVVYYVGSFAMAAASRWLEKRLRVGQN